MKWIDKTKVKTEIETDETITRLRRVFALLPTRLPPAAAQYAIDKAPIVHWLPRYVWKWLLYDIVAGLTVAAILIPQALAYAKLATIPGVFGLFSCWLPALIYTVMGTSKDLSTGPTAIQALLTAEAISELANEGYSPAHIASAMATMVGVYTSMLGFLKLGFILDYISAPVLSGFLSGAAITIILSQVGSLIGLDTGEGTTTITRNVFSHLPDIHPPTLGLGLGCLVLLVAMELAGKRWGERHAAIKAMSSGRAVLALILFTSISFGVNHDRDTFLWAVSKVKANGIIPPRTHSFVLLQKVAAKSVAPLIAASAEHLGCAKAFGQRNNYIVDESQELCYLGVTNLLNSFFGAMSVGAAMSRTAVNSECGVRSPLSGVFTSAFVLLTIYLLDGALFWIPKATLSAIIVTAIVHMIDIPIFYKFWRASLADFITSMLAFWVTLFVSTETGIIVAVLFSAAYTIVRLTFTSPSITSDSIPETRRMIVSSNDEKLTLPNDTLVVNFTDAVFFPNAERVKKAILESIQVRYLITKTAGETRASERSWSVAAEKRLGRLRRLNHVVPSPSPLRILVLDFSRVTFVDYTGVKAMRQLRVDAEKYLGYSFQYRLVAIAPSVRRRLERAAWPWVNGRLCVNDGTEGVQVYDTLEDAIWQSRRDPEGGVGDSAPKEVDDEIGAEVSAVEIAEIRPQT